MLARELLLRTSPLRRCRWLNFLTLAICLAVSAFYELIEAAAISMGATADAFLGSPRRSLRKRTVLVEREDVADVSPES